ncbi:MAG TPA: TM0106 family RecB-like putative nuclease [Aquihabitans sp.]|jgi:predicted RecB family nuclease|nr:TM0106 family RecB-like putative nuclease [Aquihabitans sp.]
MTAARADDAILGAPPARDVSSVPPQGGHVARRCPLRVQYEWFPPEGVRPEGPADLERLRAETGAAFEAELLAEVARRHPDAVVVDRHQPAARQIAETSLAMGRGVPVILGGRLPDDVLGRRVGRPHLLLRAERRPSGSWAYHPVVVRGRRTLDVGAPNEGSRATATSTLEQPWRADATPAVDRTARSHQGDLFHVAHLHRMLAGTPHGSAEAVGAVVGTEHEVVWLELDVPVPQHRWDRPHAVEQSTLGRYDAEFGFRLQVLAAAAAGEPIVGPVAVGECATCPWRHHCRPRIEAADSTSLLPGFGYRQWYNLARVGITRRAELAGLDLRSALVRDGLRGVADLPALVAAAGAADPATPVAELVATVAGTVDDDDELARAAERLALVTAADLVALDPAVVALHDQPIHRLADAVQHARAGAAGRPQLRHGMDRLEVPSADVEIDIDMESALDGTAYLWGAWCDGAYHPVASWAPPSPEVDAEVFVGFWTWLSGRRAAAAAAGASVAIYCWFQGAEAGALRRGARAAADLLGRTEAPDEVEQLLAAPEFVDLHEVFTRQLLSGSGAGLKVVAVAAGFQWRDADPSGADSMAWHARAVEPVDDPARDEARRRLLTYNEDDVRATAAVRTWLRDELGGTPVAPGLGVVPSAAG